jgi:hypothetical protein
MKMTKRLKLNSSSLPGISQNDSVAETLKFFKNAENFTILFEAKSNEDENKSQHDAYLVKHCFSYLSFKCPLYFFSPFPKMIRIWKSVRLNHLKLSIGICFRQKKGEGVFTPPPRIDILPSHPSSFFPSLSACGEGQEGEVS